VKNKIALCFFLGLSSFSCVGQVTNNINADINTQINASANVNTNVNSNAELKTGDINTKIDNDIKTDNTNNSVIKKAVKFKEAGRFLSTTVGKTGSFKTDSPYSLEEV
jgi:hypothetical protein